jgi:hypothetical protein
LAISAKPQILLDETAVVMSEAQAEAARRQLDVLRAQAVQATARERCSGD